MKFQKQKFQKQNATVLNVEHKFGGGRDATARVEDLTELGERAIQLLKDENLKVSNVKPFFWSMVETYVDRFQFYPFDINKALISYLELKDYPEETIQELIKKLEMQFEKVHGRPLREPEHVAEKPKALDAELSELRDSLKYAALVAETKD